MDGRFHSPVLAVDQCGTGSNCSPGAWAHLSSKRVERHPYADATYGPSHCDRTARWADRWRGDDGS